MCVLVLRKRCAAGKCHSATEFVFLYVKEVLYLCGRQQTLCIDIYHSECSCRSDMYRAHALGRLMYNYWY